MRVLGTISLILALGVILAHSLFPHHHHAIETVQVNHSKEDHHDHEGNGHDHRVESDDHHHGFFTYSQIENTFINAKRVVVSITAIPVIEIFEWSPVVYITHEPDHFYLKDIELPPLIRCEEISFRGPPLI